MELINRYKDLFTRQKPLASGAYTFQAPPDSEYPYRLHLRIEENGTGVLV